MGLGHGMKGLDSHVFRVIFISVGKRFLLYWFVHLEGLSYPSLIRHNACQVSLYIRFLGVLIPYPP